MGKKVSWTGPTDLFTRVLPSKTIFQDSEVDLPGCWQEAKYLPIYTVTTIDFSSLSPMLVERPWHRRKAFSFCRGRRVDSLCLRSLHSCPA